MNSASVPTTNATPSAPPMTGNRHIPADADRRIPADQQHEQDAPEHEQDAPEQNDN